jgi:hypothetical protein
VYGVFSTTIFLWLLLPLQQHIDTSQKNPEATLKATASQSTPSMRDPMWESMLYGSSTVLNTPVKVA